MDDVPILTKVFPTETTGTFVSFPVIERELPTETFDTESTKITVAPIATVCPLVVVVVRNGSFTGQEKLRPINVTCFTFV